MISDRAKRLVEALWEMKSVHDAEEIAQRYLDEEREECYEANELEKLGEPY